MRAIAANALLGLLSLGLALGAAEVVLRAFDYPPDVSDHSRYMRRDPVLGWSLRPGAEGTYVSDEYAHEVRINSAGMRGPEPRRTDGAVRIVLLGDSFVEGYSVAEGDRVSERLAALLGAASRCPVEVVPMGAAGYATDQQLLWLERDGPALDPDAVVLLFYFNDVWYNGRESYFGAPKPFFRLRGDSLVGPVLPGPRVAGGSRATADATDEAPEGRDESSADGGRGRASRLYRLAERTAKSSDLLRALAVRVGLAAPSPEARLADVGASGLPRELAVFALPEPPEVARAWEITGRLLGRLAAVSAAAGAELSIFHVPFRARVREGAGVAHVLAGSVDLDAAARRLAALCGQHRLDCLDPAPEFVRAARAADSTGRPPYYRLDTHWTAAGHAIAADRLAAHLGAKVRAWCGGGDGKRMSAARRARPGGAIRAPARAR